MITACITDSDYEKLVEGTLEKVFSVKKRKYLQLTLHQKFKEVKTIIIVKMLF